MEVVPEMAENQETMKTNDHMPSAAAFVEGGIQEACDDACSICLEEFSDSDPSTVTCCKHEFHLQCILEWCQRSSQCPMCWQSISLKDPTSQELLEAVERERKIRSNPPRHMAIFHHPTLGDFELQHLPVGANDSELEERIIQHLAAAAAMGRTHHLRRREGHRGVRPSSHSHSRPHLLVFSTHPHAAGPVPSAPVAMVGGEAHESEPVAADTSPPSIPPSLTATTRVEPRSVQSDEMMASSSVSGPSFFPPVNRQGFSSSNNRISDRHHPSSPNNQDRAGPSDLQSLSESLKSKWNAVSMRYKESISKSTRGWREKLFARNAAAIADFRPEAAKSREVQVNAGGGISSSSISRGGMERLEAREEEGRGGSTASVVSFVAHSLPETTTNHQRNAENQGKNPLVVDGNPSGSCAATGSFSN